MRIISKIEIRLRRLVLSLPWRTLLILICILIGIVAGVSAFLLKGLLKTVHNFIGLFDNQNLSNIFLVVLPIVGLILTVGYFSLFHKTGFKKGISQILDSVKNKSSIIEPNQTYGHIFSSALTIGFRGSAGFEAPFIPLLLASVTAAIISRILFQGQLFVLITNQWHLNDIPFYVLIGGLAGLYSVLIIRQSVKINILFLRISNKWIRVGIGGEILSALIFIFSIIVICTIRQSRMIKSNFQ